MINGTDHKYGFQEQEEQDELGLNWIQFKWRNHDPAIGRFFSIDPLAEKYDYQSPYNFAENMIISHREIEGLEGAYAVQGVATQMEINREGDPESAKAASKAFTTSAAVAGAVGIDLMLTKGAITKNLIKQAGIQTSFNLLEQGLSGKDINIQEATDQGIGSADLFDAVFDEATSKLPGGSVTQEVIKKLIPSMGDITLDGGVETLGNGKDMEDVSVDFSFSVVTDVMKSTTIPSTKISGNSFTKKIKDKVLDFTSNQVKSGVTKPSVGNDNSRIRPNLNVSERGI